MVMFPCPFPQRTSPDTLPAVILAAGRGERLHEGVTGELKPLTPLLGLTLLERAALACQAAGVTDCYIVVGYGKERLLPVLTALARRYRMRLHAIYNPCWPEGNGTSALATEPYLQGPFLLLMCDHVFDLTILEQLVAAGQRSEACLLAVDLRVDQVFDRDDATKVQLSGQRITAIGKDLTSFEAIDTGLFYCHPVLFSALQQARAEGDGSLSGGIRHLIAMQQMMAVPIGDRFWIDIDTAESLVYAEQGLLASLMPPGDRQQP
jgi:choline kinase